MANVDRKRARRRRAGRGARLFGRLLDVGSLLLLLGSSLLMIAVFSTRGEGTPHLFGFRIVTIQSDSMLPMFRKGERVLIRSVPSHTLSPGDIIAFTGYIGEEESPSSGILLFHTITRVVITEQGRQVKTQGTANRWEDPFFTDTAHILGRYVPLPKSIPKLLGSMLSPTGLFFLVICPAGILFLTQAVALARMMRGKGKGPEEGVKESPKEE